MKVKDYVKKIVKDENDEHMDCLNEMFDKLICDLKESDPEKYLHYKYKLHKLAYGEHLTEEMAREWVSKMKNKDGTVGEHWTWEQTSSLAEDYNKCDFYAILNMVYSDFYNSRFDTNTYITMAKDWLSDKDVKPGKVLRYYLYVVC